MSINPFGMPPIPDTELSNQARGEIERALAELDAIRGDRQVFRLDAAEIDDQVWAVGEDLLQDLFYRHLLEDVVDDFLIQHLERRNDGAIVDQEILLDRGSSSRRGRTRQPGR